MSRDAQERALVRRLTDALDDEAARAEARIAALRRDLEDIVERSADAVRDDEHDPEGATIAFERAQVTALLDDAHARLGEVARAHERLEQDTFRCCEACGTTIPDERLLARPTARTCVSCASR